MYEVKSDAPVPENLGRANTRYPWATMNVGDHFDAPAEHYGAVKSAANMASRRSKTGNVYRCKLENVEVTTGKGKTKKVETKRVTRCWRLK